MKRLLDTSKYLFYSRTRNYSSASISQLCRSFMYAPGDKLKMINKLLSPNSPEKPDISVFDLEDAVGINSKDTARNNLLSLVESGVLKDQSHTTFCVRLNSIKNEEWIEKDLDLIAKCLEKSSYEALEMINLSKVESIDDLKWLDENLKKRINVKHLKKPIELGMMIESCLGISRLQDTCENISKTQFSCFKMHHAVFGSDDFCSTLGVTRSPTNLEVLYARQHFVITTKAHNILPIDMVDIDFNDVDALEKNCKFGMSIGFVGKQVIHPKQLTTVNKVFSPSEEKILWAAELLKEYESQKSYIGAFSFKNQMIDMPTILQAKNLVAMHKIIIDKQKA